MVVATAKPDRVIERTMRLWDGSEIFYRHWPARTPGGGALLLLHRGHEHSGRFADAVEALELTDVDVFAWDQRGHGRSPGERGYAESVGVLVKDLECFARHIVSEYSIPLDCMVVLGYSVAAVLVSAWVHDYAPPVRGMVLIAPAFRVKLYVPLAIPALRLWRRLKGKAFIKSYVKPRMLTHDPEMAAAYARDELISRNIAVNILLDLYDTSTRLLADAGAIRVPTLVLRAGSDYVVKLGPQKRFFDALSSPVKDMETYQGFYHALLHERERHRPIARIRDFVERALRPPPPAAELECHGRDAYERRRRPPAPLSTSRLGHSLSRVFLKTVGRLSTGIRLGWRTGFDSGEMLDYVYRNSAGGSAVLGRLIDRSFLDSPGWTGIRRRRENLQALLTRALGEASGRFGPVRVLDIASGPGRYLLETLKRRPDLELSAHLRDRDPGSLEAARKLAAELDLANVTIEEGDAFDAEALAAIRPRPHVAVVSGLYELFEDNDCVRRSLEGLARVVEEEGFLIYTNQPWHPQLEFIARVLVNREGRPWVMRCRAQTEMDDLVRAAGFAKVAMETDENAIFTVSLARKLAP